MGFSPTKIVRVIGPEGEQLGLLTLANAQKAAYDREFDLVMIAPQSEPPVCKVMDYGRFRFERDKKDKEAKKRQQISEVKEVQLSCHIDINDFNTKLNHARRFLQDGDKVKVIVRFRGRQMTHTEIGRELLSRFVEGCAEFGAIDKAPILEGKQMIVFISPQKQTAEKAPQAAKSAPKAAVKTDENPGEKDESAKSAE